MYVTSGIFLIHLNTRFTASWKKSGSVKASNGKRYVSAVFDCFDSSVLGLAMDTNMKAPLCVQAADATIMPVVKVCGQE